MARAGWDGDSVCVVFVSQAIRCESYQYKSREDAFLSPFVSGQVPNTSSEHIAHLETSGKNTTSI